MGRGQRTDVYDEDAVAEPAPPALLVVYSPDAALEGRSLRLGARLGIGRAEADGVDVAIDDVKVSRRHATVARAAEGFTIEDHDSRNGTFVDGVRVRRAALAPGSVVRVGETLFELTSFAPPATGAIDDPEIVGRSPALRAALAAVDRVAPSAATVLIIGETGAGKEHMARRLHQRSGRPGPLVAVNCGAIPTTLIESALFGHRKGAFTSATVDAAGYFAAAQHGTLFLDEIGVLPSETQPKLLRVLETRAFVPLGATGEQRSDARVVAATNVDLAREAAEGRFRRDLYARLAEYTVEVSPLRARRADIPLLARHFLGVFAPGGAPGLTAAFVEALLLHDWPMNVRELRAAMQRAVIDADGPTLKPAQLPEAVRARPAAPEPSDTPTREELEALLVRHHGNLAQVAQHYGKARMQVYRWLSRYEIDSTKYRS